MQAVVVSRRGVFLVTLELLHFEAVSEVKLPGEEEEGREARGWRCSFRVSLEGSLYLHELPRGFRLLFHRSTNTSLV